MAAVRATAELYTEHKLVRREVPHVADSYQLEAALVRSKNVVTSRPEDSSLPDLGPSLQLLEPTVLTEVADQVYETVIYKEVRHFMAPQDPCLAQVHVQALKDNGVLEPFQSLLQVWQVLKR